TGGDVVFLSDGANLAAVLAAHMPDDLDVLLSAFWFGDSNVRVEHEVGLGLRIADNCQILFLQYLGNRADQRLIAIPRRTRYGANRQPRAPADLGLARSLVLQQRRDLGCASCPQARARVLAPGIPIGGRSIEPLGVFADAPARRVAQLPQNDQRGLALR